MVDAKLWPVFSEYIRLKYSDPKGFITCYTCGGIRFWRYCDAGHGLGRQHLATKYNEVNVRPQCKPCNGFHGGKREEFKRKMDLEHGEGTWERLEVETKRRVSWAQFDIEQMILFYKEEVKKLKNEKCL